MALTLYMHPLASFCHKALIALYEAGTAFTARTVDLGNPAERDHLREVWPMGKFPVLRDDGRDQTVPESSVIIEYLDRYYPGAVRLIPADPERAAQVRSMDRFYDLHVHENMQKIVGDKLRPADGHDPIGVEGARSQLRTALGVAEEGMSGRTWAAADQFSMADCAAAPPLFFINRMMPLASEFPQLSAYLGRLMQRPSYARTLHEAQPYMSMFPG